jgi:hypothetical protein
VKTRTILGLLGLALAASGCLAAPPPMVVPLATARVAEDFDTYSLRRVGLIPPVGELEESAAAALQQGLLAELSRTSTLEIVVLSDADLEEVEPSEPFRRGWYRPRTILELSRRYSLDGLLFVEVTDRRFYPPQTLGLQVDLVSTETGLVVWSSALHMDASDEAVRVGMQAYYGVEESAGGTAWQVALLSPERFARFAAYQVASLL